MQRALLPLPLNHAIEDRVAGVVVPELERGDESEPRPEQAVVRLLAEAHRFGDHSELGYADLALSFESSGVSGEYDFGEVVAGIRPWCVVDGTRHVVRGYEAAVRIRHEARVQRFEQRVARFGDVDLLQRLRRVEHHLDCTLGSALHEANAGAEP